MISDFSKRILDEFQVRKKRKEKDAFIELLRSRFPELKVEEAEFPVHTKNIVIGDLESAKVVLTAHYDTCARMIVPNFLAPRNRFISYAYQIGIGFTLGIVVGALMGFICRNTIMRLFGENILSRLVSFLLIMYVFLWMLVLGPANRHTANDNTSGVITLITLLENMSEEERRKCCFVFFDMEEAGLWGSRAFNKTHRDTMKDKLLINYDCVSDGEYCMLVEKEPVMEKYDSTLKESFREEDGITPLFYSAKSTMYPSDQKNFPTSTAVAFFHKHKTIGYYISRIHTSKDTVFEEKNITYLEKATRSFLSKV